MKKENNNNNKSKKKKKKKKKKTTKNSFKSYVSARRFEKDNKRTTYFKEALALAAKTN